MKILVTGTAGFIGMHVALRLLERGDQVIGIDNLNDYYDPELKTARLECLKPHANFRFARIDVADSTAITALFSAEQFDRVVHLAAQGQDCHDSAADCAARSRPAAGAARQRPAR